MGVGEALKLAFVAKKNRSSWVSCRSITANLRRSYELAFPEETASFSLDGESALEIRREVLRLREFNPSVIVFADHAPHPGTFLSLIKEVFLDRIPMVIIHVFGDFTLNAAEWAALEPLLKQVRPLFVCASPKQELLLRSFLESPGDSVTCIPFPVQANDFHFDPGAYRNQREKLGCEDSDFVFFYSGRLSVQKNNLLLIQAFAAHQQHMNPRAQLWLAGPVDDLGVPYLGREFVNGTYANALLGTIRACLPGESEKRVRYLGDLSAEELRKCYNASDCFFSLSTHNDEDYGMAPAEALCCGTPVGLTDWGGYSSFKEAAGEFGRFVPVQIGKGSVEPEFKKCVQAMTLASFSRVSMREREELSRRALGKLSCEAVAEQVSRIARASPVSSFSGFSEKFHAVAKAFRERPRMPFGTKRDYSDLYRDVYGCYL